MVSIFSILDGSFLITLGVILLISGIIMLYCYRRLNLLESGIIEQGRILQTFIMNYNNVNNQLINSQNFKNPNTFVENYNKIDISDDENNKHSADTDSNVTDDEDDDEDDDDDQDDDIDSEDDIQEKDLDEDDDDEDEQDLEQEKDNIEKIDIKELDVNFKFDNIKNLDDQEFDFYNDITMIQPSSSKKNESPKIVNLNNEDLCNVEKTISKNQTKGFSKMKIDDLRVLAVTKNKLNNEEASKLKKKELIELLQN